MAKKEETTNIVSKGTEGYGYKYASLGDIAKQGFTIPKMKTATENEREYIYYFDTDIKEWIRGAEIVIPEGKGMNKAQLYGSALTYARRYTALLALQLACDLDENIENLDANGEMKTGKNYKTNSEPKKATANQINYVKSLYSEHDKLLKWAGVTKFEDLTYEQASELIGKAKQKQEETDEMAYYNAIAEIEKESMNA